MKKILLILTIMLFTITASNAQQIVPQKITGKQSRDYQKINTAAQKALLNAPEQINTSQYPPVYKNYRLMLAEKTQSSKFYYVKCGQAELMYDRATKNLRYITFRKLSQPKAWVIYSYPSGKMIQADIWLYMNEVYSFNSDGAYIDYKAFKKEVGKTVKSNWNLTKGKKFKYALTGNNKPKLILVLTIDYKGSIVQCKALQQTKNEEFNNSVYEAVWKSSPFANIPYTFTSPTIDVQIEF